MLPALAAAGIGIVVVLAVGLSFYMQTSAGPPSELTIELGPLFWSGNAAAISVDSMSLPIAPQAFRVDVSVNGTEAPSVAMPTQTGEGRGVFVSPPGYRFRIDWWDNDYDTRLSTTDAFTISIVQDVVLCCITGTFSLRWAGNDALLAEASIGPFTPNTASTVTLGPVVRATPASVVIPVVRAVPPTPGTYFQFLLSVNSTWSPVFGLPLPNGLAGNVSVDGATYGMGWIDANDNQRVDGGDAFSVTLTAGSWPPPQTDMEFVLQWQNGLTIAEAFWTA